MTSHSPADFKAYLLPELATLSLMLHHDCHLRLDIVKRLLSHLMDVDVVVYTQDPDVFQSLKHLDVAVADDISYISEPQLIIMYDMVNWDLLQQLVDDDINCVLLLNEYQLSSLRTYSLNFPDANILWIDFPQALPIVEWDLETIPMTSTQLDNYNLARASESSEDDSLRVSQKHLNTVLGDRSLDDALEIFRCNNVLSGATSCHVSSILSLIPKLRRLREVVIKEVEGKHLIYSRKASWGKDLITSVVAQTQILDLYTNISKWRKAGSGCICLAAEDLTFDLHRLPVTHVHLFEVPTLTEYKELVDNLTPSTSCLKFIFYCSVGNTSFRTFDETCLSSSWEGICQILEDWAKLLPTIDTLVLKDQPILHIVNA